MDQYSPVRGKCTWWREVPRDEDRYDVTLKPEQRRILCTCFIEGYRWDFVGAEIPAECPNFTRCRYYIKSH